MPVLCSMIADEATVQYFDNFFKMKNVSDCVSISDRDAIDLAINKLFENEDFDDRRRGLLADRLLCELDKRRQPADFTSDIEARRLYKELVDAIMPMVRKRIKKRAKCSYDELQLRRDEFASLMRVHPDLLKRFHAA